MNKKMGVFWVTVLLLFGIAGVTNATTIIDFEGVIPVGSNRTGDPIFPYLEDGFLLTDVSSAISNALFGPSFPSVNSNGTDVLGWVSNSTFQISDAGSALFSILSFDGTNLNSGLAGSFEVTGFFGLGGSISTSFANTLDSFSTFTFDPTWSGLSSVQVTNIGMINGAFDNITLSTAPVPEPSTMLLLSSGLVGLIGFNYRRRKQSV